MNPDDAIELGREAVNISLVIGGPVLIAGLVVGLVVGLLQAITQIQEQTVAFVPKLVAMVLVLSLTLPWIVHELVQYSHDLIENIPQHAVVRKRATPFFPTHVVCAEEHLHEFLIFALVLVRIAGLVLIAPVVGSVAHSARACGSRWPWRWRR